jgi:hypothetical protein
MLNPRASSATASAKQVNVAMKRYCRRGEDSIDSEFYQEVVQRWREQIHIYNKKIDNNVCLFRRCERVGACKCMHDAFGKTYPPCVSKRIWVVLLPSRAEAAIAPHAGDDDKVKRAWVIIVHVCDEKATSYARKSKAVISKKETWT